MNSYEYIYIKQTQVNSIWENRHLQTVTNLETHIFIQSKYISEAVSSDFHYCYCHACTQVTQFYIFRVIFVNGSAF